MAWLVNFMYLNSSIMLRTISLLTTVVAPFQIWLKCQSVCSSYCVVGYCGRQCNDLSCVVTYLPKCFAFCLHKTSRRKFKQFSETAVSTCSEVEREEMAPTRVILMSCGSYNPPTNMHLRMFGTYISFLIINIESLRKQKTLSYMHIM